MNRNMTQTAPLSGTSWSVKERGFFAATNGSPYSTAGSVQMCSSCDRHSKNTTTSLLQANETKQEFYTRLPNQELENIYRTVNTWHDLQSHNQTHNEPPGTPAEPQCSHKQTENTQTRLETQPPASPSVQQLFPAPSSCRSYLYTHDAVLKTTWTRR